jgi:ribosomal-protein-alanine N-acetyltransferase
MARAFSIRLFRHSDLDDILQIEHASFREDAYDRNLFAEFHNKCGELFLVAVKGRRIRGYAIACIGGGTLANRAELISIAVDPKHRGKGIASALMDSMLRRLRRRGVTRFHLIVKITNDTAIRFYEGYCFQRGRIVRRYYEDGADGRQMFKTLDSE